MLEPGNWTDFTKILFPSDQIIYSRWILFNGYRLKSMSHLPNDMNEDMKIEPFSNNLATNHISKQCGSRANTNSDNKKLK